MKYLIIIATIMWGAFFYTNAKAHSIEEAKEEEKQLIIPRELDCIPQMEPMTNEVEKSD
jgi:hypothetical protein